MKHIPFAALSPAERQGVLDAFARSGMPLRQACVSRSEPVVAEDGGSAVVTVTTGAWVGSYEAATAGWTAQLQRDLLALRRDASGADAQCGLHEQGDTA